MLMQTFEYHQNSFRRIFLPRFIIIHIRAVSLSYPLRDFPNRELHGFLLLLLNHTPAWQPVPISSARLLFNFSSLVLLKIFTSLSLWNDLSFLLCFSICSRLFDLLEIIIYRSTFVSHRYAYSEPGPPSDRQSVSSYWFWLLNSFSWLALWDCMTKMTSTFEIRVVFFGDLEFAGSLSPILLFSSLAVVWLLMLLSFLLVRFLFLL